MYTVLLITFTIITSCLSHPKTPRIYNVIISTKKNLSPSHAQPIYEPVLRAAPVAYAFSPLVYHTQIDQTQSDPTILQNNGYIRGNPAIQELTQEIIKSPSLQALPFSNTQPVGTYSKSERGDFVSSAEHGFSGTEPASVQAPVSEQAQASVQAPVSRVQAPTLSEQSKARRPPENEEPPQPLPVEHFISYLNPYTIPNYSQYLPKESESQTANQGVFLNPQNGAGVNDPKPTFANFKVNKDIPDVPPPPIPVKVL